jgi:hypothetical protein
LVFRVILFAYEASGGKFLNRHAVKAHEVRALASSWALFNSASISEVLFLSGILFFPRKQGSVNRVTENLFLLKRRQESETEKA